MNLIIKPCDGIHRWVQANPGKSLIGVTMLVALPALTYLILGALGYRGDTTPIIKVDDFLSEHQILMSTVVGVVGLSALGILITASYKLYRAFSLVSKYKPKVEAGSRSEMSFNAEQSISEKVKEKMLRLWKKKTAWNHSGVKLVLSIFAIALPIFGYLFLLDLGYRENSAPVELVKDFLDENKVACALCFAAYNIFLGWVAGRNGRKVYRVFQSRTFAGILKEEIR